jgi:hypothetical protein
LLHLRDARHPAGRDIYRYDRVGLISAIEEKLAVRCMMKNLACIAGLAGSRVAIENGLVESVVQLLPT